MMKASETMTFDEWVDQRNKDDNWGGDLEEDLKACWDAATLATRPPDEGQGMGDNASTMDKTTGDVFAIIEQAREFTKYTGRLEGEIWSREEKFAWALVKVFGELQKEANLRADMLIASTPDPQTEAVSAEQTLKKVREFFDVPENESLVEYIEQTSDGAFFRAWRDRSDELKDVLEFVSDKVCSALCPVKWKTGEPQPHSPECARIRSVLGKE